MNPKFEKALPIILTTVSCLGVVGTSVLVANETLKAHEKAKNVDNKKEKFKIYAKEYIPAILVGAGTIASMIGSTSISRKIEASLAATAIMADRLLRKYKGKIKEVGEEGVKKIKESIAEDDSKRIDQTKLTSTKKLYWEEHIGYFEADPVMLEKACSTTNERLQTIVDDNGQKTKFWASLKTFLYDADAVTVENEPDIIDSISFKYGWSYQYLTEAYDNLFIHLTFNDAITKDGIHYTIITFDKDPIYDAEHWDEYGGYDYYDIEREHYEQLDAEDSLAFDLNKLGGNNGK